MLRTNFPAPTSLDAEAIKRNAFHDQSILMVSLDHPGLTWPEREMLHQIGQKLYGRRRTPAALS